MRPVALFLVALLLATAPGCSRPSAGKDQEPVVGPRYSSNASADHLGWAPGLSVVAEQRWEPRPSKLLPDPVAGVWGGQDGELFHFAVRSGAQRYQRVTYGRPDPASVWTGDLVWLSPNQIAGVTSTLHLVRRGSDGELTEFPGRSPDGFPLELLDVWDGAVRLRDAQGTWVTLQPDGRYLPVTEPLPLAQPRHSGIEESAQEQLRQAVGERFLAWGVDLPDGSTYALVTRQRFFTFDLDRLEFSLTGRAHDEIGVSATPIGTLDGQILSWFPDRLIQTDPVTGESKLLWSGSMAGYPYVSSDGWLYLLPGSAVNLRTGETVPLESLRLTGGISVTVPLPDGRLASGTGHGGSIFLTDPASGKQQMLGRPLPGLGQESGEEMAPIDGLAVGADGMLYALIGSGAQGSNHAHLVRVDPDSGKTMESIRLGEAIHSLVAGADGRLYASGQRGVIFINLADR